MVYAAVLLCVFNRHHILYILHYADGGVVAGCVSTDAAEVFVRDVMTFLAILYLSFQVDDGLAKVFDAVLILPQDVESQAQGRALTDTRKV